MPSSSKIATLALGAVIILGSLPARAVTCEDVRDLSATEQSYWSKLLHLSSQQRQRIWVACYRDYRAKQQQTTPIAF
jgi:hypothetical protein